MKRKPESEEEQGRNVMMARRRLLGDGNLWVRGPKIGEGGFGSVYIANLRRPTSKYSCFPPIMAVKSSDMSDSVTLQKEKEVLFNVHDCPNVICCFGEEMTMGDNGSTVYNLLLEYASGGTLASLILKMGAVPDSDVRCHTRSLLKALKHIRECGYVHCDLKPENVLLVPSSSSSTVKVVAKIADFGLAKRAMIQRDSKRRKLGNPSSFRGTPRYLSPEAVLEGFQETPSDIWALGCVVLEMLTGKPTWNRGEIVVKDLRDFLSLIASEVPDIPRQLSKDAKDFLSCCFVRSDALRWTADMLFNHHFVAGLPDCDDDDDDDDDAEEASSVDEDLWEVEGGRSSIFALSSANANADGEWVSSLFSSTECFCLEQDLPPVSEVADQVRTLLAPNEDKRLIHSAKRPVNISIETRLAAPVLLCQ